MPETNDFKVFVFFNDTSSGHAELKYAADIATRLNSKLIVLVRNSLETAILFAKNSKYCVREILEISQKRIREKVSLLINACLQISYKVVPDDLNLLNSNKTIVVSNSIISEQNNFSVIAPFDEIGLLERGPGEIMIPFGNGESGIFAANKTLPIIKRLGLNMVFWHTTWKNPAIASEEPKTHMVPEAKSVLKTIREKADELGIKHRSVIETADDVVEGILRFALKEHSVMIVMARGRKTGEGRYGDRLIKRSSPIPIFMAGRGA